MSDPRSYDDHQLGPLIVCALCRRGVYSTTHRPICLSCQNGSPPLGPVWTPAQRAAWLEAHPR